MWEIFNRQGYRYQTLLNLIILSTDKPQHNLYIKEFPQCIIILDNEI